MSEPTEQLSPAELVQRSREAYGLTWKEMGAAMNRSPRMIQKIARGESSGESYRGALTELYDAGLKPDWWKLEPQASRGAWAAIDAVIEARDPLCRGVVLLGLEAPYEQLKDGFAAARTSKTVRGFAVGRTIFADAGRAWLGGTMSDDQAIADMAGKFKALVDLWLQLGETKAA